MRRARFHAWRVETIEAAIRFGNGRVWSEGGMKFREIILVFFGREFRCDVLHSIDRFSMRRIFIIEALSNLFLGKY